LHYWGGIIIMSILDIDTDIDKNNIIANSHMWVFKFKWSKIK
jgi:hypothetical protein